MKKNPETIDDILKYFKFITYHDISLSRTLTNLFSVGHMYGNLHNKTKLDFTYKFRMFRIINFILALRRKKSKEIKLRQADYLLITHAEDRLKELTFPVLKELNNRNCFVIYVSSVSENKKQLFPTINIEDVPFNFFEMQKGVSAFWKQMKLDLQKLQNEYGFSNLTVYSISCALTYAVSTVLKAELLLSKIQPKVIFTDYDHQHYTSIIIQAAQKLNIPTVTLVHGLQGKGNFDKSTWVPILADKIIVWGEWMERNFQEMGVPVSKIKIGGYPRLRPISKNDVFEAKQKLSKQLIPDNNKIILFISSYKTDRKPILEKYFSYNKLVQGFSFLVRPHPQENLSWYIEHAIGHENLIQDPVEWKLSESIASADVVVGSISGACIDAMLLGKEVVIIRDELLNFEERPMLLNAIENGEIKLAKNLDELLEIIKSGVIFNKNLLQPRTRYASVLGEEAAKLTARVIMSLESNNG